MKCAIISVSQVGADLARMIGASLQADVDLYERKEYASGAEAKYFTRVMALTTDIFTRYDLIIYIMALGITVRAIAPHVQHKTVDPAIL
ncbi:MAG: cobalamin biosynthesis protein CbiG, partial [Negativicoccus succinicivorans]|nr:cobalamin biosynthesis protein CbiG [Negativicoccus succinicivorans]